MGPFLWAVRSKPRRQLEGASLLPQGHPVGEVSDAAYRRAPSEGIWAATDQWPSAVTLWRGQLGTKSQLVSPLGFPALSNRQFLNVIKAFLIWLRIV